MNASRRLRLIGDTRTAALTSRNGCIDRRARRSFNMEKTLQDEERDTE
jgi:hypothetical protein